VRSALCVLGLGALVAALLAPSVARGQTGARQGKQLFLACAACHSERQDALGPSLRGVVGRPAASLLDFRYSSAMRRARLVWTEANLSEYLTDPQAKVPGNRMAFSGLSRSEDIAAVIAYLKELK
jgi:cytochrome c